MSSTSTETPTADLRQDAIAGRVFALAKRLATPDALFIALSFAVALAMFFAFNSRAVLSYDAYTSYMPAALALERGNLGLFREMMALGIARPPLLPVLIVLCHSILRFLSVQEITHLISCASAALLIAVLYKTVRRWMKPAPAAIVCALFFASPVFLPYVTFGTPDTLFAVLALSLADRLLERRAFTSMVLFALLCFCRPNSIIFVPGLLLFFAHLFRVRHRHRWLAPALLVLILFARARYGHWVAPGRTILTAHHAEWSRDLFLAGAEGARVRDRLRPMEPAQYWLFIKRLVSAAPATMFSRAFADAGMRGSMCGALIAVGFLGALILSVRRLLAWRELIDPEVAVLSFGGAAYVVAGVYHWETRYWMLVYLASVIVGSYLCARAADIFLRGLPERAKRAFAMVFIVIACWEIAASFRALSARTPMDDATWRRPEVEENAEGTLRAMLERSRKRPIKVLNCDAFSFQLLNLVRLEKFADDFDCVTPLLKERVNPEEIDFAVFNPSAELHNEAEKVLFPRMQAMRDLGYGTALFERR